MKKPVIYSVLVFLLLTFIGCAGSEKEAAHVSAQRGQDIVAGSGSNLAVTGQLIEEFNQKFSQRITMPNSIGSSGAIQAVVEGAIQLGLTSRQLKETEKSLGLKEIPYVRLGIVFGVNHGFPDTGLSSQDLVDIYSGRKTQWQNGQRIVVLARENGDSTNSVLEKLVPGFQQVLADAHQENRWQVMFTDQEEANAIIEIANSFGFTDTAAMTVNKLPVKPLQVDGVKPEINNVADGTYKFFKDLFFVYKDPLPDEIQAFLDFVYSDEGQRIISCSGGIPLRGK